jgi:hypothetical protein
MKPNSERPAAPISQQKKAVKSADPSDKTNAKGRNIMKRKPRLPVFVEKPDPSENA